MVVPCHRRLQVLRHGVHDEPGALSLEAGPKAPRLTLRAPQLHEKAGIHADPLIEEAGAPHGSNLLPASYHRGLRQTEHMKLISQRLHSVGFRLRHTAGEKHQLIDAWASVFMQLVYSKPTGNITL